VSNTSAPAYIFTVKAHLEENYCFKIDDDYGTHTIYDGEEAVLSFDVREQEELEEWFEQGSLELLKIVKLPLQSPQLLLSYPTKAHEIAALLTDEQ